MKVKGKIAYRRTSSGNLIGEFAQDGTAKVYGSAANRINLGNSDTDKLAPDRFAGTYRETWIEEGKTQATTSDLTITYLPNGQAYELVWDKFKGKGYLVGDLLVGNYETK